MKYGAIKEPRVKVLLAEVGYLITRLNTTKISARNHVLYVNAVWENLSPRISRKLTNVSAV
jgi:hypothetical protein